MEGHFFLGTESLVLCLLKEGNDCRQPKSRLRFIVNFFALVRKFCFAFRELFKLPSSVCGYILELCVYCFCQFNGDKIMCIQFFFPNEHIWFMCGIMSVFLSYRFFFNCWIQLLISFFLSLILPYALLPTAFSKLLLRVPSTEFELGLMGLPYLSLHFKNLGNTVLILKSVQ